jgi:hypothetical protein
MLQDLEQWLIAYRNKANTILGSTNGTTGALAPVHDYTGYAYTGLYRMAANGQPQFVLGGDATRAAEQIMGGGLSQNAVLSALARGSGGGRSLTIQDNSRFDGRISSSQMQGIKREIRSQLIKEFIGA